MDMEETKVDMKSLIEAHGEKEINKMQVGQLRKLHSELKKRKEKINSKENPSTLAGNLGIKRNPLKNKKNPTGRIKKRSQTTQASSRGNKGLGDRF